MALFTLVKKNITSKIIYGLILIAVFLSVFNVGAKSQDTAATNIDKENLDIELTVFSLSAYYSRLLSNQFSLSIGGGIGKSLNFILINYVGYPEVLGDYLWMRFSGNYEPAKNFTLSMGIQASWAGFGKNEICEECGSLYLGVPISISYGWNILRIGTRITPCSFKIGNTDPKLNLLFTPIFIKFVI